jgi:hypothetical protein
MSMTLMAVLAMSKLWRLMRALWELRIEQQETVCDGQGFEQLPQVFEESQVLEIEYC